MRLTWPLTGRTEQMRTIASSITTPDSAGVVVSGGAGVGKSRLAREAMAAAESQGLEGRWVGGTASARAIPLGAFTAWIKPGVADTVQLLRSVIESLTATSAGGQIVLAVDDAHLLDDLATFVVHQLVQRRAAKVILTVRDDEPIPDAVREIWKVGQFDRIDLQPLSPDETTALLSATLGGPVDPAAAQHLWRLTGGNALYLRDIAEQEVTDGRLARRGQTWRWTGDPILPPDLVGLVESRIGTLPESLTDVIDVLAVAEPIDLQTLSSVTNPAAVPLPTPPAGAHARTRPHTTGTPTSPHPRSEPEHRQPKGMAAPPTAHAYL
ncbi:MAG TPA: AAA family ATPase [Mycobacterium sp.]